MSDCSWKCLLIGIIIGILLAAAGCWTAGPGAGEHPQPAPAGMIWKDNNPRNCMKDGSETGFAGIKLLLKDTTGTVITTAVTDAKGNYAFPSDSVTAAGNYDVVVDSTTTPLPTLPSCDTDDPSTIVQPTSPEAVGVTIGSDSCEHAVAEFGYQ